MPADPYAEYQQPLTVRSYGDTAQIQEEETPSDPYAAYQKPAAQPESKGFLGGMWDEVKKGPANLLGVGNSINQAALHPKQTLESMGAGISDMAGKTADSFKRGDYRKAASQAVNTGLNAVVPGLGTSSEEAGEKLRSGDVAGGLGQTAGIGVNTVIGAKTPQILKGAARILPKPLNPEGSSLAGLTRANPRVAMTRALRPTPSDTSFNKNIPTTLSNVKEANAGVSPKGNAEMLPAVDKAIASHQSVLDQWMQRAGGRPISGAPIVEATRKATEGMLPSEQGAAAAQIERAAADYGHNFTPQELKARLELLNKRIDSFASQAPGKQSAALADIPDAVLKAQRDATADTLYRALDPEGQGAGPRLIQRQIGDMIGLKDAALRRSNAILAEQPVSPLGAAKDTLEKIPFVRNFVPGAAGATKGVNVSFSDSMKGRSDPLIRRSFDAVGKPNAPPRPGTDLYPMGDESRMLTAGDAIPPAPPDTSFVRGMPLDASQAAAVMPKALPPGSAPFTQGTAVPDVQGRPDLRAPYSRGLLEAPKLGQPPVNVQPRGPGSVQTPPYMPQEAGRPLPMEGASPKQIAGPAAPEALEEAPAPQLQKVMPEAPEALEAKPSTPQVNGIADTLQSAADAALERMRKRGTFSGTKLNAQVPVEDMGDMAIWGATKLAKGTVNFSKWSAEMIADAGEQVKPELKAMYAQSQKIYAGHVEATGGKLAKTKQLLALYQQGKAGEDWYKYTRDELTQHFGEDAPLFVDMLAATSPNATVTGNVTQALKAYTQFKTGQPFKGYMPAVINNLEKVSRGEPIGGQKVSSFKANLFGDTERVTIDRWMARAMGWPRDNVTPAQYKFLDYTVTQAAKHAGVEPRQMQAAVWTAIKENEGRAGNTAESFEQILARNISKKPELAALLRELRNSPAPPAAPPQ